MQTISSITAFYPHFALGHEPQAIECTLSIVEANGKRYLKTPFAFVNAYADDDAERQIGRGYYATAEDCNAYLRYEYPNADRAQPIMEALADAIHHHGTLVGPGWSAPAGWLTAWKRPRTRSTSWRAATRVSPSRPSRTPSRNWRNDHER